MAILILIGFVTVADAGERGPGKYSGVALYDRWDGCTLYSGIYVMYVAESAKEGLRAHAGESVQVDAREVRQDQNPGDGLIKTLDYLGPAPPGDPLNSVEGLRLHATPAFEDGEKPSLMVTVENVSRRARDVKSRELAITLLTRKEPGFSWVAPADGPSFAVITRQALWNSDGPRMAGGAGGPGRSWNWRAGEPWPQSFDLTPGEGRRIRIDLDLPEGQYDFIAGYGGGVHAVRGLASNLVAFDVGRDGKAVKVKVKGR